MSGLKFSRMKQIDLDAISKAGEGTVFFCEDEEKFYLQTENGPVEIDASNTGIQMNLYELNKNVIGQLEPMTRSDIGLKIGMLNEFNRNYGDRFYMLLCREFNYYTIFACDTLLSFPDFGSAVSTIISELGEVYSIELASDGGAIEIWLKPEGEEAPLVFYLFPYDKGVVYYG